MALKPYYEEGGIQIFLGDCRDVLPKLGAVDVVISDPPYGIGYKPGGKPVGPPKNFTNADRLFGDDTPFEPGFLLQYQRLVLFGANHYAHRLPPMPSWVIWDKTEGLTPTQFGDAELIWTNAGGPCRIFRHLWSGYNRQSERDVVRSHPTQKPVALLKWLVERFSDASDVICDPFMGSGTTLVAAKNLGRRCIGIEIERAYCDIAIERLRQGVLFPAQKTG